eukprot:scaffold94519_cov18-Tisochrysis_lutea.AAC.2
MCAMRMQEPTLKCNACLEHQKNPPSALDSKSSSSQGASLLLRQAGEDRNIKRETQAAEVFQTPAGRGRQIQKGGDIGRGNISGPDGQGKTDTGRECSNTNIHIPLKVKINGCLDMLHLRCVTQRLMAAATPAGPLAAEAGEATLEWCTAASKSEEQTGPWAPGEAQRTQGTEQSTPSKGHQKGTRKKTQDTGRLRKEPDKGQQKGNRQRMKKQDKGHSTKETDKSHYEDILQRTKERGLKRPGKGHRKDTRHRTQDKEYRTPNRGH